MMINLFGKTFFITKNFCFNGWISSTIKYLSCFYSGNFTHLLFTSLSISNNWFNNCSNLSIGNIFGPSDGALSGS